MFLAWPTLRVILGLKAALLLLPGPLTQDRTDRLIIQGTEKNLGETPLVVEVKPTVKPGSYEIKGATRTLRADIFQEAGKTYLGTVLDQLPARSTLSFEIPEQSTTRTPGSGVELIPQGRRIEIRVDGKLVTEYCPDDGPKPYLFPLIGPSGSSMTRAFPMKNITGEKTDHPHHRSFWFTHGSVNKVDFWSELPGHGRIVETSRPTVLSGMTLGRLRTTDDWLAPDGQKICEDERVLTIYATRQARILDFDVTLKATAGPVTFGDTKEGMFGLRLATTMDVTSRQGGKIVNAQGVIDKETWGKSSSWVDYAGPVAGKVVGVAILNHPSSFRYPTTWHVRDYGLFAANPFGYRDFGQKTSGEFLLPAGQTLTFRYRIILHDGDTASAEIPTAFQVYANPPIVTNP